MVERRVLLEPSETKRTIIPKAEQRAEWDEADFLNKLKIRFQRLDTHVVGSYLNIMKKFKEGKMSEKKLHQEVVSLLYYHEDLIEEFSRYFNREMFF